MARMRTSITGIDAPTQRGFTLVEIVAATAVVGAVLALAVPQSIKFYEGVKYRTSVRETITLLNSARYAAVAKGVSQDVLISPNERWIEFDKKRTEFAENVDVAAHSAKEVNRDGLGIIRFYPDGGASGGGIDISRGGSDVTKIAVDWLVGRVSVEFPNAG
jgi:general secretion pathway protein H